MSESTSERTETMRYYKHLALLAAAVFALTACGSKTPAKTETKESSSAAVSAQASSDKKDESAAAKADKKDESSAASAAETKKTVAFDARNIEPGIYRAAKTEKGFPVEVAIHPYQGFSVQKAKDDTYYPKGTYIVDKDLIFMSDGENGFLFRVLSNKQMVFLGISMEDQKNPTDKGLVYDRVEDASADKSPLKYNEMPMMVYAPGGLYRVTDKVLSEQPKDTTVEKITEILGATDVPSKVGQANFKAEGYILQKDKTILVKVDDQWRVFALIPDSQTSK